MFKNSRITQPAFGINLACGKGRSAKSLSVCCIPKNDEQKGQIFLIPDQMFLIDSSTELQTPRAELVLEKINRPDAIASLSRERLLTLLSNSLSSCAATILSGRAGTGKTSLAVDFALKCGRASAWYKVDAPDSELPVFFNYLLASIREQRPGFGSPTLASLLENAKGDGVAKLAEVFVYELGENDQSPLLIVIEDLHQVCDAEWLVPFFRRLLPLLPSEVHLLITSRTLPPAPLWRMRSKQTLRVISEEELAFTRPEATALFENYGLTAEQAYIALDHTHGRAAALANCAQTLAGS